MTDTFTVRCPLAVSAAEAFAWHARPGAFERLAPPWQKLRIIESQGGIRDGATLTFEVRQGPLALRWKAVHSDYVENQQFCDTQASGPFAFWRHVHRFHARGAAECELEDAVEYRLRGGPLGRVLLGRMTRHQLERLFRFRHARTHDDLQRHALFAKQPRLRVAVSGASGLIGAQLCAFLSTGGHDVHRLVRGAGTDPEHEIAWNPAAGAIDAARLEGIDAVVHLGGANIGEGRWTAARKAEIRQSRVASTTLLAEALAKLARPPRVLVVASAVGFYGSRGDTTLDEKSDAGSGFLADVTRDWEAATAPAERAGLRVVHARFGPVVAGQGGMLAKMLPAFLVGAGGPIGSGRQVLSWISLDDVIGMIHCALLDNRYHGPINAVAPHAVTQRDFAQTLGRVLHRPALAPLPAFVVRTLFGQMGEELLLGGVRVAPRRATELNFQFLHLDLEGALRAELGR